MQSYRRWVMVGCVAAAGVVLVALGIQGLGQLLEVGKSPVEMLTIRVRYLTIYTTALLALGFTLMSWCGITGIAWAGSVAWKGPAAARRPADQG
jgi:hypothetical protein